MVTCTERDVTKWTLHVCNVLFFAFGMIAIAFGNRMLTGNTSFQKDLKDVVASGSLLIIGGVALLLAIVLGTLGALKYTLEFLRIYPVPIAIALLSAAASIILLYRANNSENIKQWLETALDNYNSSKENRGFWGDLQRKYKCCGIDGYGDWKPKGISLPESCCQENPSAEAPDENESCKSFGNDLSYVHKSGCRQKLIDAQDLFISVATYLNCAFLGCVVTTVLTLVYVVCDILQKLPWSRREV